MPDLSTLDLQFGEGGIVLHVVVIDDGIELFYLGTEEGEAGTLELAAGFEDLSAGQVRSPIYPRGDPSIPRPD